MADLHMAPTAGRFEVRVTSDSHFSWVRTRLSLERTMMSWQRTAVALIGFGFQLPARQRHTQPRRQTHGGDQGYCEQEHELRAYPHGPHE